MPWVRVMQLIGAWCTQCFGRVHPGLMMTLSFVGGIRSIEEYFEWNVWKHLELGGGCLTFRQLHQFGKHKNGWNALGVITQPYRPSKFPSPADVESQRDECQRYDRSERPEQLEGYSQVGGVGKPKKQDILISSQTEPSPDPSFTWFQVPYFSSNMIWYNNTIHPILFVQLDFSPIMFLLKSRNK